jgi:hypothetical protein
LDELAEEEEGRRAEEAFCEEVGGESAAKGVGQANGFLPGIAIGRQEAQGENGDRDARDQIFEEEVHG